MRDTILQKHHRVFSNEGKNNEHKWARLLSPIIADGILEELTELRKDRGSSYWERT